MAAVSPAGPEPTMMTSRVSIGSSFAPGLSPTGARLQTLRSGLARSRITSVPAEPPAEHEDSAEPAPRGPDVSTRRDGQEAKRRDRGERERREQHERREHAVDDGSGDRLNRLDRAFAYEPDRVVDRVG